MLNRCWFTVEAFLPNNVGSLLSVFSMRTCTKPQVFLLHIYIVDQLKNQNYTYLDICKLNKHPVLSFWAYGGESGEGCLKPATTVAVGSAGYLGLRRLTPQPPPPFPQLQGRCPEREIFPGL